MKKISLSTTIINVLKGYWVLHLEAYLKARLDELALRLSQF